MRERMDALGRHFFLLLQRREELMIEREFAEIIGNGYTFSDDDELARVLDMSFQENVHKNEKTISLDTYNKCVKVRKSGTADRTSEGTCSICQCGYKTHLIATLGCDHDFHHVCIKKWLLKYGVDCPLCKTPVD